MYRAEYIIGTVDRLVSKYKTRDPYELCRALRITVYKKDLRKKLKGFFFYQSRQKNIVIDSNVSEVLERILVAHEMGHALLHREVAMMRGFHEIEVLEGSSKPMEYEANLFAAELLLEDEEVMRCLSGMTFFETAKILNVPAAFLDFKCVALAAKGHPFYSPMNGGKADFLKDDCGAYRDCGTCRDRETCEDYAACRNSGNGGLSSQ